MRRPRVGRMEADGPQARVSRLKLCYYGVQSANFRDRTAVHVQREYALHLRLYGFHPGVARDLAEDHTILLPYAYPHHVLTPVGDEDQMKMPPSWPS